MEDTRSERLREPLNGIICVHIIVSSAAKLRELPKIVQQLVDSHFHVVVIPTPNCAPQLNYMKLPSSRRLQVIDLAEKSVLVNNLFDNQVPPASAMLIAPATFNTVSKIANGICDNYALSLVASAISEGIPLFIAPSYSDMWNHPLNETNLNTLRDFGFNVILPDLERSHITMAPASKITDTVRSRFNKVKYEHNKLNKASVPIAYSSMIEKHLGEFQLLGKKAETDGINSGLNGCAAIVEGDWLIVTSTGCKLSQLAANDLALVNIKDSLEQRKVMWHGSKLPSSETPLHLSIVSNLPAVKSIVHTHFPSVTYDKAFYKYKTENYAPYGEFELDASLFKLLKENGFGIMRLHGELAVGDSLLSTYDRLKLFTSGIGS